MTTQARHEFDTPDFLPIDPFSSVSNLVDPSDDIFEQAASGSVAAIVQVLNQRLADRGVRTRAMVDAGWLQLLCESVQRSALDRETLIEQVRTILEDIDPAKIRRVQINSRLAREQQLLWLDDIRRQPKQLLWSEPIRLRRSNPIRRLWKMHGQRRQHRVMPIARSRPSIPSRRSSGFGGGIAIGLAIALFAGLAYRQWSGLGFGWLVDSSDAPVDSPVNASDSANSPTSSNSANSANSAPIADPFAAAVTLATQAAIDGQTAISASEWLDLSARWQRAAELMEQLPTDDPRSNTANERAALYRQNSAIAQQRAAQ
ncbi:MAG: hypothetical protein HC795_04890 [Coleofasciculaceae cyanobacterium RL_1_1]|nr:hypothetical protein [Coleofasciculaceae cyanobacterium RL_1_1]